MNTSRTARLTPRFWVLTILILGAVLLTACEGGNESWAGISTDTNGETVVVSFEKQVVSYSADGSRNWTYRDDDSDAKFYAPSLITADRVYVGDYSGRVHAINRADGKRIWIYEPKVSKVLGFSLGANDRILGPVAQSGDSLFFGNEHGVVKLDISGEQPREVWKFETEHSIWAQPLYVNNPELGEPTLFVAALDQHLYALNPDNGEERWSVDLEGAAVSHPVLDAVNGRLYIGTLNYKLYAFDFNDGAKVAEFKTEGWIWDAPLLEDQTLYFGDLSGWLYALPITSDGFGEVWKTKLSDAALRAAPVLIDGVLVVASQDEKVYAINLDDKSRKWEKGIGAPAVAGLFVLEGEDGPLLVVGTKDKENLLVTLRLDNGEKEWGKKYED
ncbi:MAG: PQQ-binding-like beta-propeller repeat protein [Anaerolineae bacterium]|nr:PQQ-binding-like beta-propeller repeat protein [Anaerolineae bacterium]